MLRIHYMAGALALAGSTLAYAQATQPTDQSSTQQTTTTTQQTPDQTKTTTTRSTTTTQPTPDQGQSSTTQSTSTTATQPATSDQGITPEATPPTTQSTTTATTTTTTQPVAATADDVKTGVSVYDQKGGLVGKVASVSANGAVVNTGKARAEIPLSSFAKNDKGLVMSMTKAELEAASAKAAPPKKK
jgi:hypothetical protein